MKDYPITGNCAVSPTLDIRKRFYHLHRLYRLYRASIVFMFSLLHSKSILHPLSIKAFFRLPSSFSDVRQILLGSQSIDSANLFDSPARRLKAGTEYRCIAMGTRSRSKTVRQRDRWPYDEIFLDSRSTFSLLTFALATNNVAETRANV